jgi:hypothetical protein
LLHPGYPPGYDTHEGPHLSLQLVMAFFMNKNGGISQCSTNKVS